MITEKKIKIISGQYFEALSGLMKADLITDIYGVFSYSGKLDEVLRKYLDLLNPNGTLFIASSIADTWGESRQTRNDASKNGWKAALE